MMHYYFMSVGDDFSVDRPSYATCVRPQNGGDALFHITVFVLILPGSINE